MGVIDTVEPDTAPAALGTGALAAVGVPLDEERVYLFVLDRPGVTAAAISRAGALQRSSVEQAVKGLVDKGLIAPEPGPAGRYRAAAPDVAIGALVARHHEALARARLAASALRERARQAVGEQGEGDSVVETATGGLVAAQRLWQLQMTAEREIVAVGLPATHLVPTGDDDEVDLRCLRQGVSHRSLYDRDELSRPGVTDRIRTYAGAGGEVRVADTPVQVMIIDGKVAILPEYRDRTLMGAELVRSAPIVKALVELCDTAWSHATSVTFDGEVSYGTSGANANIGHLVPLLVAGCKDDAIARQIGVSTRTLDRRIRALMDELGAVTRFQAGWLSARRQA